VEVIRWEVAEAESERGYLGRFFFTRVANLSF